MTAVMNVEGESVLPQELEQALESSDVCLWQVAQGCVYEPSCSIYLAMQDYAKNKGSCLLVWLTAWIL